MTDVAPLSRRAVLRAGAVLPVALAAGCTLGDEAPQERPAPHPDVVRADEAAARERRLLAAYDQALLLAPDLAPRLAPLRHEHRAHLDALQVPEPAPTPGGTGRPTAEPTGEPTAAPGEAVSPSPSAPGLPAEPAALLAALADLERETAAVHAGAAVAAGRGLAVVLAAAAASESSHVVALA